MHGHKSVGTFLWDQIPGQQKPWGEAIFMGTRDEHILGPKGVQFWYKRGPYLAPTTDQ